MTYHRPKTVLITGATGDFGKAFATRFAEIGSRLVLHGRNKDKLSALAEELSEAHGVAVAVCVCDVSDSRAISKAVAAIAEDFRDIDLLINNAGLALGQEGASDADLSDWLTMIDVNNRGLVTFTHEVLKIMNERGAGHIINIGSTAGSYPYPGGHVYCASKAFVKQFSLSLRADLLDKNIRVTNIEPGMVETQFSTVRFKGDAEKAANVYASTDPLTAEDVAESVFWAATLPPHFNVNRIEMMPTRQAPGPLAVDRD